MAILNMARNAVRSVWRKLPLDQAVRAKLVALLPRTFRVPNRGVPPEMLDPSPPCQAVDDCFVFAVIDWHYRFQRPQHLAAELVAAGRRVFYVSNNFIASRRSGFLVEQLDDDGRLYQVFLNLRGAPEIYFAMPTEAQQAQLHEGMRSLLSWARTKGAISLIQHPFWANLAAMIPHAPMVYDCMDYHEGFGTFSHAMVAAERALMARSDLVVVSSALLNERAAPYARRKILIRNAADFAHFSTTPGSAFRDPKGRRVLGYYGAIAAWFDVPLVEALARHCPGCLVVLIGHDQIRAKARLAEIENIALIGEIPYRDLPWYLHGFDVCILPFLVNDLTRATNPVKVYEYLSAGKTVVAVDLPELRAFDNLVVAAPHREFFLAAVDQALSNPASAETIARRRTFAAGQTWAERGQRLNKALTDIPLRSGSVRTAENAPARP